MKPPFFYPLYLPRFRGLILVFVLYVMSACGSGASGGGSAGGGRVTLHWQSPTASADGSSLNDLDGFRVYYGKAEPLTKANAKQLKTGKDARSQLIEALSPGTYFFAVTAIDTSGNESAFSEVISTDISGV